MLLAGAGKLLLVLGLALHHRFNGPSLDYYGLAAAAAASWVGLPGPGEPVLIAAGVFAARHRLDITSVLAVAWAAATIGGVAGWLIGIKAGRGVLTTRGPLHRMRLRALESGDEVFGRHPVIAIVLTPSWVAGIHGVRSRIYLPINAAAAALWAVGIGLGAYLIGPSVVDFVGDLGTATEVGLVLLVVAGVVIAVRRRRPKGGQSADDANEPRAEGPPTTSRGTAPPASPH